MLLEHELTIVDEKSLLIVVNNDCKAGERGGGRGGGKIPGARTGLGARDLDKTSGHCATVKRVGGP